MKYGISLARRTMARASRVTLADIVAAREKVVELLMEQCEHGQQTVTLGNTALAACGQFIGEAAKRVTQRGLHGTAAAVAVLASVPKSNTRAQALLPRLVKYTSSREEVEE
jgi:hypothetical protein